MSYHFRVKTVEIVLFRGGGLLPVVCLIALVIIAMKSVDVITCFPIVSYVSCQEPVTSLVAPVTIVTKPINVITCFPIIFRVSCRESVPDTKRRFLR